MYTGTFESIIDFESSIDDVLKKVIVDDTISMAERLIALADLDAEIGIGPTSYDDLRDAIIEELIPTSMMRPGIIYMETYTAGL